MKRSLVCTVFVVTLVVATASTGWAQAGAGPAGVPVRAPGVPLPAPGGRQIPPPQPPTSEQQTALACQFCFTCGGNWPVFAGYQHSSPDPGGHVQRGPECSGLLTVQPAEQDLSPFLCCRYGVTTIVWGSRPQSCPKDPRPRSDGPGPDASRGQEGHPAAGPAVAACGPAVLSAQRGEASLCPMLATRAQCWAKVGALIYRLNCPNPYRRCADTSRWVLRFQKAEWRFCL
jgi:hypothetical protein